MVAMRRDAVVNHDSTARSGLCARGECSWRRAPSRCRRPSWRGIQDAGVVSGIGRRHRPVPQHRAGLAPRNGDDR